MTVRDFPNATPNFFIGFQGSRKLDPRITFTRASGSNDASGNVNGQVRFFPLNVPRLTDQGLLIEGSRINQEIWSTAFSNWRNNGSAINVTDNAEIAPDGTQTASTLANTNTANAGRSLFSRTNLARTGQQTAQQLWIRRVSGTDPQPTIRLQTIGGGPGVTLAPPTNEWQQIISIQTTLTGGTFNAQQIDFTGAWDTAGTANDNVYAVWGSQIENNTGFASSYIPTNGATVTRAADICDVQQADFGTFYNAVTATVIADSLVDWVWDSVGNDNYSVVTIHQAPSSGNAQIRLFYRGSTEQYQGYDEPGIVYRGDINDVQLNQTVRAGITLNTITPAAAIGSVNGETPTLISRPVTTQPGEAMRLGGLTGGNDVAGRDQLFGYIQGVTIYPTNLTQDNLNSLTTVQT